MSVKAQQAERKKSAYKSAWFQRMKNDPDFKAKRAAAQREYRRLERVSENLHEDDKRASVKKNATLEKRLSHEQLPPMTRRDGDDVVAEDDADGDENEDDFQDEPEFDDQEIVDGAWSVDLLQRLVDHCNGSDQRMQSYVGLPCAVYDDAFKRVAPHLAHTRYDGHPRLQVRTNSRMSDELQFFLFATWLRQVSLADLERNN